MSGRTALRAFDIESSFSSFIVEKMENKSLFCSSFRHSGKSKSDFRGIGLIRPLGNAMVSPHFSVSCFQSRVSFLEGCLQFLWKGKMFAFEITHSWVILKSELWFRFVCKCILRVTMKVVTKKIRIKSRLLKSLLWINLPDFKSSGKVSELQKTRKF